MHVKKEEEEEEHEQRSRRAIKVALNLLVKSPRSTLERYNKSISSDDGSSVISSSASSSDLGTSEEEQKGVIFNKREKFPFLAVNQKEQPENRFVLGETLPLPRAEKSILVSKIDDENDDDENYPIVYQVCEAILEEDVKKCERSCTAAMGVLKRATVFPSSLVRPGLSKKREEKNLERVVAEKERDESNNEESCEVNKEGALEENYSYLYVVKKEEEANLSPIERIFGPVSEDVLAVARVKFISRDDDDDGDDDIDVKTASANPMAHIAAACDRFFIANEALFVTSRGANAAISFFSQLLLDGVHRVVLNRTAAQKDAHNEKDVYFSLQCVPPMLPENASLISYDESVARDSDDEIVFSSMKTFTLRATLERDPLLETATETNLEVAAHSSKGDYGKSNSVSADNYVRLQPCSADKANASLVASLYDALFASASEDEQRRSKIEEDVFVHDIVSEAFTSSIFDAKSEVAPANNKTCLKTVLPETSVITPCLGVSPEHGRAVSKALDEWSKARSFSPSSLFRDVSDDDKLPQNSSIIAKVKRQKVILLGSDVMSSLSLDAVVTEICREMDSEEAAFAGEKTLATATFLASASRGEKSTGNYGGIFFDAIAKHENSAHLLLLKLASFGIYPLRGTYDVSLFDFCDEPAARPSSSPVSPSSDANVLFIATFRKRNFKIINTLSISNVDKLVEIEREAWISCPEMRTSEDTIRDRVLNNRVMNFAIFDMDGEYLEETNDSLKGMMYTQFVKSTEDVSNRNCWATKESARVDPFSSQTIQLLDVFADQRYSLENGGDVGMQLRDFVLHFAERVPMVQTVCAVTRTRGFREVQQKAIKEIEEVSERTQASISGHLKASLAIPTYEQHVMSKEGGYNDRGLFLHVGAGAKILKVQYGWRPKDYENDGNGTLIEYKLERLSWRRYSNVKTFKSSHSSSSSSSMVEAVASAIDTVQDEKMGRVAAT